MARGWPETSTEDERYDQFGWWYKTHVAPRSAPAQRPACQARPRCCLLRQAARCRCVDDTLRGTRRSSISARRPPASTSRGGAVPPAGSQANDGVSFSSLSLSLSGASVLAGCPGPASTVSHAGTPSGRTLPSSLSQLHPQASRRLTTRLSRPSSRPAPASPPPSLRGPGASPSPRP